MAICWMLTADDGRADGSLISYFEQPTRFRHYDPRLFDHLRELVLHQSLRDVRGIETDSILPSCRFAPGPLPDDARGRAKYFEAFAAIAKDRDLIFLDPDNGIEVRSKPYGRKGSSKYVYWRELIEYFSAGHSLLVYQHFPRVKRDRFVEAKARELAGETRAQEVYSFRTPRVLFLLAPKERHRQFFRERIGKVAEVWRSQIKVVSHCG